MKTPSNSLKLSEKNYKVIIHLTYNLDRLYSFTMTVMPLLNLILFPWKSTVKQLTLQNISNLNTHLQILLNDMITQ